MINYKNKYLKYKKKYIHLQKQLGGIHKGETSIEVLDKLVSTGKLNKFDMTFDSDVFDKLKHFFTNMKNDQEYLFIPKVFNEENYIGKRIVTLEDINKMWYSLEKRPTDDEIVKMLGNKKFQFRVKRESKYEPITFDGKIIVKTGQVGKIKIELNGKEEEINTVAVTNNTDSKINDYINIVNIYRNYAMAIGDQSQYSNFSTGSNKLYLRNTTDLREMENRLDGMFGGSDPENKTRTVVTEDGHENFFITYKKYNILVKIDTGEDKYLYIIPATKIDDKYEIMPYNYKNTLVNDNYYDSVKKLFELIVEKLNEIMPAGRTYANLPDGFFHLHVVDILDENKIMMIIHAKYEVENSLSENLIKYKFKDTNDEIYEMERNKPIDLLTSSEANEIAKKHSFCFLFDLDSNSHNLFSVTDEGLTITDSNGISIWGSAIAFKDNVFGANIADLNYIINRPIVLTIYSNTKVKCDVFCPNDDMINSNVTEYILDEREKKCAEIKINTTDADKSIFLADVLVNAMFSECKLNFKQIMDKIDLRARTIGATTIKLDDDSFMQFPKSYTNSESAKFKWSLAFLKKTPSRPSIYYNFGYEMQNKNKMWIIETLKILTEKVSQYNTTNAYDLVINAFKLGVTKRNLDSGKDCTDLSKCFANEKEYEENLAIFEREYNNFQTYITDFLTEFININRERFTRNDWQSGWLMGFIDTSKFSNLYKALNFDAYEKKITTD